MNDNALFCNMVKYKVSQSNILNYNVLENIILQHKVILSNTLYIKSI